MKKNLLIVAWGKRAMVVYRPTFSISHIQIISHHRYNVPTRMIFMKNLERCLCLQDATVCNKPFVEVWKEMTDPSIEANYFTNVIFLWQLGKHC